MNQPTYHGPDTEAEGTAGDGSTRLHIPVEDKPRKQVWYRPVIMATAVIVGIALPVVSCASEAKDVDMSARPSEATEYAAASKKSYEGKDRPTTTVPTTEAPTTAPPTTAAPKPTAPPTTAAPKPAEPPQTDMARQKAQEYLDYSAFSRSGLIEQLEYEGFPTDAATVAVDSLHVNWTAQADAKAKEYIDYQAFSHSGLVEQLVYEGFSQADAEHGATAALGA